MLTDSQTTGDDLEDESLEPVSTTPTASDAFDFSALLAEALQHKAEGQRIKEGRQTLRNKGLMPSADVAALLEDVKRLENKREWLPRADVMMFTVQHCTYCDNYSPLFTGLFQRQVHKHQRDSMRWIAAQPEDNIGLVKEVKSTEIDVSACHFCVTEQGYPGEQLGIVFDDAPEDTSSNLGEAQ